MIFVTVGTQKFQFNRMLSKIDELISKKVITEKVICQSGYSTYNPKNYKSFNFLDSKEYKNYINSSNLLITHAGVGTILEAKKDNIPVIVIPRMKKYGEHVDDHQIQIARDFDKKGLVLKCENLNDLSLVLRQVKSKQLKNYKSNNCNFVNQLEKILESNNS